MRAEDCDVALAEKIAALSRPQCYPGGAGPVEAIETHMSWVFLTPRHAWKLKKPVRYDRLDFRTGAARHFYALEELRLNRRLAPDVYLDVVPLTRDAGGALRVAGEGATVDWLVQMRRLDTSLLLDGLLAQGTATGAQMRGLGARLAAFYRGQPAAALDARAYRALLLRHIAEHERELCEPAWNLPASRMHAIAARQRACVEAQAGALARRVAEGRVVEGHGDLRPEHVWFGEPPAIIDALEFSAELRLQDAADEVAFLALECERARRRQLGEVLLEAYREASGDAVDPALLHLYRSCKACARARLAIAHLREERYRGSPKWRRRCLRYLVLAERHLRAAELNAAADR